eukprot:6590335-Prymnesium_polylepis.1
MALLASLRPRRSLAWSSPWTIVLSAGSCDSLSRTEKVDQSRMAEKGVSIRSEKMIGTQLPHKQASVQVQVKPPVGSCNGAWDAGISSRAASDARCEWAVSGNIRRRRGPRT